MRAVALALMVALLCGCGSGSGGKVTFKNYEKIEPGMSLEQITKIMGPAAQTEDSDKTADGKETTVCRWVGDDGMEYIVKLQNNMVEAKAWEERMAGN